jgi:hypothetical protein
MNIRNEIFGHLSDDEFAQAQKEAREEQNAREERKNKSLCHYAIPDWQGQGGMVEFWLNSDGAYECMDTRIDDAKIRDGIRAFARDM